MRTINWINYKSDAVSQINKVVDYKIASYMANGKVEYLDIADPNNVGNMALVVKIEAFSTRSIPLVMILNDKYCWLVSDNRLSSLEFHNRISNVLPWLTIGDRDYIVQSFMAQT